MVGNGVNPAERRCETDGRRFPAPAVVFRRSMTRLGLEPRTYGSRLLYTPLRLFRLQAATGRWCALIWSVGLLLMAPPGAIGQGGLMSVTPPQDSAVSAAQVELFILRASIPPSATLRGGLVAIGPDSVPLAADRAAEILAGTPKPIRCVARATKDVLSVECVRLSGAQDSAFHTEYVKIMEEEFMSARGSTAFPGLSDMVLLRSAGRRGEELSVPAVTFARWYREYQLPPSITFGIWPAAQTQRAGRAQPIFDVHTIEPVGLESRPPKFRSP